MKSMLASLLLSFLVTTSFCLGNKVHLEKWKSEFEDESPEGGGEDGDGGGRGGGHGGGRGGGGPPGHHRGGHQKREAPYSNDDSPVTIEQKLNSLRGSASASNMYYANRDRELEKVARELIRTCHLHTEVELGPMYKYANGMTGYYVESRTLSAQLESVHRAGSRSSFYRQMMSSRLTQFGCAVRPETCYIYNRRYGTVMPAKIFACIYAYKSDPTKGNLFKTGTSCSSCDKDALWCEQGLCRGSCGSTSSSCDCEATCSKCSSVRSRPSCQCLCYHGDGSKRCRDKSYASSSHPVCSKHDHHHWGAKFPVGWVICIVISCVLLLTMALIILSWRCLRKHQRIQRRQPRVESSPQQASTISSGEFGPNFVPVLSPPPYIDASVKPPPYDPVEQALADKKTSQEPIRATISEVVDGKGKETGAYDNNAYATVGDGDDKA